MTTKPIPHQVGECPSGATTTFPPASTLVSTLPQPGSGAKASPRDPLSCKASKYRSAKRRKDLEYVLKNYYQHNVASFKESEWLQIMGKFFAHLLPLKVECLAIKENQPMNYMPYMEDHFVAATGLRLSGLRDFAGSYYHGLVAQQGHLHLCPHLAGVPLPSWLQTMPSESRRVSQRKPETQATSPSMPSTGAGETQVTSSSVPSTGAGETPEAHSDDTPAPMETGGVGDGQTWAEQVEARAEAEFQKDRLAKHRRSQSRKREGRLTLPFRSRMSKEDAAPLRSCTDMQVSKPQPASKWSPWE